LITAPSDIKFKKFKSPLDAADLENPHEAVKEAWASPISDSYALPRT